MTTSVRRLWIIAVLEMVSLAVLLLNLATVDDPAIAQGLGPVHGFCYLVGIALGWGGAATPRARLLLVVPVVGVVATAYRLRDERPGAVRSRRNRE